MKKFKQAVSALTAISLLSAYAIPVSAEEAASVTASLKEMTVVFDGERYQTKGYKSSADDTVYVSADAFKTIFGTVPSETVKAGEQSFGDLKAACDELGYASYEYDDVLDSVYIWSKGFDTSGGDVIDLERVEHYGLGAPSDANATYSGIMTVLDKAVSAAAPSRLSEWQSLADVQYLRDDTSEASCFDASILILRLASFLGGEYTEFNYDFGVFEETYETKGEELFIAEAESAIKSRNDIYGWGGFEDSKWLYEQENSVFGVSTVFVVGRQSLYSQKLLFDFGVKEKTLHLDKSISLKNVMLAAARLLDSSKSVYEALWISSDSTLIRKYNDKIITPELLEYASSLPDVSDENPPDWRGIVSAQETDPVDFEDKVRTWSQWGYNSVRYTSVYYDYFNYDCSKANESKLRELDQYIAIAAKYKMQFVLTFTFIPGQCFDLSNIYLNTGDFELYVNPEKQRQAKLFFNTLAARYAGIPNSLLTFYPLQELLLSGDFDRNENSALIASVFRDITDAIRKEDPDRFIIWENPTITPEANAGGLMDGFSELTNDYSNVMLEYNFGEGTFIYYQMTDTPGENYDNCQRAMYQAYYPCTLYYAQPSIYGKHPIYIDGDLFAGSTVEIGINQVWTDDTLGFRIIGDGEILYKEDLVATKGENVYNVTPHLSGLFPYSYSDKVISVTLDKDYSEIIFEVDDIEWTNVTWSGIKVTLPEEYAVKRWFEPSMYEWYLEHGVPYEGDISIFDPYLRETSEIMIPPGEDENQNTSNRITVSKDITYSTELIRTEANADTIDAWGKAVSSNSPETIIMRFENASFSGEYFSSINYYDDILNMCEKYGISWFSNDFGFDDYVFVSRNHESSLNYFFPGSTNVPYKNGWLRKEMFEMYDSHLPKTDIPVVGVPATITIEQKQEEKFGISGSITSYGDEAAAVTLTLLDADGNEVSSTTGTSDYSFDNIAGGNYTLRVTKTKHCPRDYSVTVNGALAQDIEIKLYGDVDGDGSISIKDALQIVNYRNSKASAFDKAAGEELTYLLKLADLTNDDTVNITDALQIVNCRNSKASAFDKLD